MITLGDLLRIIDDNERITIEMREEETDALLDWWYRTPSLLFSTKEIKDMRCAHVKEIKVDSGGEMVISIPFDTEG